MFSETNPCKKGSFYKKSIMKFRMLTITSNPNNILELESHLQRMLHKTLIQQDRYADILISLTEAVNNAIIHGNKRDESKMVHIDVIEKQNGILFCVTDEGCGFNPGNVADPTCEEKIECCGGRGVYIMRALSDKIAFKDKGRSVEMFFKMSSQLA
jgi:serine/threonine-protein kinase RsbW